MCFFKLEKLKVFSEGKEIVKGINLKINRGEIHFLLGPNGSGKSTLAKAIIGWPKYKIEGKILFEGKNITNLSIEERARLGIFLGFQNPIEIEGLSIYSLIKALNKEKYIDKAINLLKLDKNFIFRDLNYNLSGGEKKKAEILQMLVLNPKFVILDEFDTGLDVDSLKIISKAIKEFHNENKAFLIITHYTKILEYINPDKVHVMINGKIVESGDKNLAFEIEKEGYKKWIMNI